MTKSSARSSSSPNKHSKKRKGFNVEQRKSKKPKAMRSASKTAAEDVINRASQMNVGDTNGQLRASVVSVRYGNAATKKNVPTHGEKSKKKKLKLHKTLSGAAPVEVEKSPVDQAAFRRDVNGAKRNEKNNSALSKMLEKFTVDNSTYSLAKIRATFYPKFEFEKSDREIRTRMIALVSKGLATLEVSLKHSGSLFMYAGCESGAYAKNSFGNIYTAVGVFVLGRTFQEAWGGQANKKQSKFNAYIERKRMCISMELVTAVLGDHGQRPREDYVVVTAVTELGKGKPVFYSTPDIIRFCRKWRLPTNHVWMFSTRKSVTSFFAVYDALCEEGTATPVCQALDEVADLLIPGSKDHTKMQGEILEGLVARIVSHESSKRMEQVLNETSHQLDGVDLDLGPSLREICAANRSDEKKLVKALLQTAGTSFCPNFVDWFGNEGTDKQSKDADELFVSKFLQANPSDLSTTKCQEMIRLMKEKRIPAAFRCHYNFQKAESMSSDNLHFKMAVHILYDKAFQRYQKEMRYKPGLWPLYRGFFVDVNLYKTSNERASDIANNSADVINNVNESNEISGNGGLADEDVNLMIKMKFLTYKLRTFLMRNGLSILFKEGPGAYKAYYMRQMKRWNTSQSKQREISKLLDEWAHYIRGKYGHKKLTPSKYLTEVEPFLESYGKQSPQNQALIGSAGNMVRAEDISAIIDSGKDEEEDVEMENQVALSNISASVVKDEGLIIFFPGIPGCGKSALCKEILSLSEGIGDGRPVQSLMGDLTKGNYWAKVGEERKRKPYSVMLADKNAPNSEVWRQIEGLCLSTKASAVPVVPDCEGTETNPYSLDALAVFTFRVLLRAKHPGKLDNACPTAGYVLLKFYHLFDGQDRIEFETELVECFGSLVKMPLLKPDRNPLPEPVRSVLEEGINLFKLHFVKHGRLQSSKGMYAPEWSKWEKKLRDILFGNAEYLNSIQVPFQYTVERVLEQLRTIAKGEYPRLSMEKKKLGCIIFAAVDLSVTDIQALLCSLAKKKSKVDAFLKDKNMDVILKQAHLTLAHKKSQGVTAVANYGSVVHKNVPVKMTALFLSDKFAALEAHLGSVDGEEVKSMIKWPHITLWTANGVTCKEAVTLPQLYSEGKATRIKIKPPVTIVGTVEFH